MNSIFNRRGSSRNHDGRIHRESKRYCKELSSVYSAAVKFDQHEYDLLLYMILSMKLKLSKNRNNLKCKLEDVSILEDLASDKMSISSYCQILK